MSKKEKIIIKNSGGGIGFFSYLFLVFLVLKLTSVIDWSWWWVTAPLWGPLIIALIVILIICVVSMFVK